MSPSNPGRNNLHDRIEKVLDRAQWVDVDMAKVMSEVTENEVDGGKGTLASAATQLPPSLEHLTPEEIAKKAGGLISIETIDAYLNLSGTYDFIKVEGAGKASYSVMLDGSVKMDLHLEAGIGVGVGEEEGANAGVTAGGTEDVQMRFKSEAEAQRFLRDLKDAAKPRLEDWLHGGGATGSSLRVAELLKQQNITSNKVGLYGKAEGGFKAPFGKVDAHGRIDGYYDTVQHQYGVKVEAEVKGDDLGGQKNADAGVKLDGEVKTDSHKRPQQVTLSGEFEAGLAEKKLGIKLPASGGAVEVELKMDHKNVMWHKMQDALNHGDMSTAADIAMSQGEVVVSGNAKSEIGTDEAGSSSEVAKHIWVREANTQHFVSIDPQADRASPGKEAE